jgi:hypothetical protein
MCYVVMKWCVVKADIPLIEELSEELKSVGNEKLNREAWNAL